MFVRHAGPSFLIIAALMRVLHVIASMDPKTGGPPAVAARLAAAQAGLGHHAAIAALDADLPTIRPSLAGIPGIDSVALHAIGAAPGLRRVSHAIAAILPRPDVYHVHGVWDITVRAADRASGRTGVPTVIVPHGMLDPWSLRATPLKRLKKWLALRLVFRRILNSARFYHVLNRDERDLMAPLGLTPPCEVIPNGVFPEEFDALPAPGAFAAARPELAGRRFILFLSRLHHKKGLDILAQAFARLAPDHPDVSLVVAGPDGGALAPLRAQAKSLGIEPRLVITGPLYGEAKLGALMDAAVFCLPSRQEGFSMAITEAMACGRPVVVSRACHFPEVTEHGAGLEVDLTPEATAAALARLLSNPDMAGAMGRAGRTLVRERFTWPTIARRTIEAYTRHGIRAGS